MSIPKTAEVAMTDQNFDTNISISMYDLIISLSNAADLVRPELISHHKQVAYLSFKLGKQLRLSDEECRNLLLAGLLHDVGALSVEERLELLENEPPSLHDGHAAMGASLLSSFPPLKEIAKIIRYHHVPWDYGKGSCFEGNEVPFASHIIHLADRISILLNHPNKTILNYIDAIHKFLETQNNSKFHPQIFSAFEELCSLEYIWLDLTSRTLIDVLPSLTTFSTTQLNLNEISQLTHIFAKLIDYRSPFTANHSIGVAKVAEKLAELAGFSEKECQMMLIAGHLHDLGKLAIPNEILEKPSGFNENDYNIVRSHTFYTYRLLQPIKGFETINQWAAFHHERLNGTGYPFHLTEQEIPMGSRIMAVADIFTAMTEDRPYRNGMKKQEVLDVFNSLVKQNAIAANVADLLLDNYDEINEIRKQAQLQASLEYNYIMNKRSSL